MDLCTWYGWVFGGSLIFPKNHQFLVFEKQSESKNHRFQAFQSPSKNRGRFSRKKNRRVLSWFFEHLKTFPVPSWRQVPQKKEVIYWVGSEGR
jgi:hypothetical protein